MLNASVEKCKIKLVKRGQSAWNTSDHLFFLFFFGCVIHTRAHTHTRIDTPRIVRRQLVTRAFENRGAASVARSKLPPRYPSYRPEHYVSHHVAHDFCRRGFALGRTLRDERKKVEGVSETKEQGNKRTNMSATHDRVSRDLHLLVTSGCVFCWAPWNFAARSRERDLLRRFRVTRFVPTSRTRLLLFLSVPSRCCPRTSNFPHPHFPRVFNLFPYV